MGRLLIVEDQPLAASQLASALERAGYAVEQAESVHAARLLLACQPFDAIISDVNLPDGEGPALLLHPQVRRGRCPVCLVTGEGGDRAAALRQRRGVVGVFEKPADTVALVATLAAVLETIEQRTYPRLISEAERSWLLTGAMDGDADDA